MSAESPAHEPAWLEPHQPSSGRYVLGPILGQGGAGEVREAWDVVLCRRVALKVLRKMEPVGLIRFMHEAQIQSRIVHPNICRIYDVDNSGGVPKIAMQLVHGPTLAEAWSKLTVHEVVTILAQVAEAIHAAHRIKLIHRDLKPSNILLELGMEGRWVPYVCDFGLAMALDEPSLTLGSGVIGTPAFMAPEQIRGERRRVGPATDIFALGGTLHYALFGEPPNLSHDREGDLALTRQAVFPPSRSPDPDLPRDLETILRRCLELEPEFRYPSAQALAEDLWLFADNAPIHARPVGLIEHRWRQAQQYRTLAIVVFLAAAGILTGRLVEKGRMVRAQETRAEWARSFVLEAADMEKELRLEKMLPAHDMRPCFRRIRNRMDEIRGRMRVLGPGAQGPGHYALGRGHFLLEEYAAARDQLERAWALDFHGPEVSWLLARSLAGEAIQANGSALYRTGLRPAPPSARAHQIQDLIHLGAGSEEDAAIYGEAIMAFARGDYRRAAGYAHTSFLSHPWRSEAAFVESFSRTALARQRYDAGDLAGAEVGFREAMAAAQQFLDLGQSDVATHRAFFLAAEGLACVKADQGRLTPAFLDDMLARSQRALVLDPMHPDLQDAWLAFTLLKAHWNLDQGRDMTPQIRAAMAFLLARGNEPLPAELRADRMILYWLKAERRLARGRDPMPMVAEAMKDLGHTSAFRLRDAYGELMNFQARVLAARGEDPRPGLDSALEQMRPLLERRASWTLAETAAESWLIRAQWEAGHGGNARDDLQRGRGLAEWGLQANPRSARGHALMGLARALEIRLDRNPSPLLVQEARRHLRLSQALGPGGWCQDELRTLLDRAPGRSRQS